MTKPSREDMEQELANAMVMITNARDFAKNIREAVALQGEDVEPLIVLNDLDRLIEELTPPEAE